MNPLLFLKLLINTCTRRWASTPKAEGTAPKCRVVAAPQTRRLMPLRTMTQRGHTPPRPMPAPAPRKARFAEYDADEQYRIVDTDFDILGGYESAPPPVYAAPLPQPFDALPPTVMERMRDSEGNVKFTIRLGPALPPEAPPVDSTPSPSPAPAPAYEAPSPPAPSPSYDPPPAPPAPSPSYDSSPPPPSYDSSPPPSSSWD